MRTKDDGGGGQEATRVALIAPVACAVFFQWELDMATPGEQHVGVTGARTETADWGSSDHTSEATSSPPLEYKEARSLCPRWIRATETRCCLPLQYCISPGIRAMLLGSETGMASYAGHALLGLLVHAYAAPFHFTLCGHGRARTHLVFVGDGPFRAPLQALCVALGVLTIFTGQLTGRPLSKLLRLRIL
ncbi:hypothetical protein K438DRAFT_2025600 [Mycena galopus ATCC 62051]|nr:hypothetical protein K438DRAFT_2025600 [Mycena galopus ATCC 62051]